MDVKIESSWKETLQQEFEKDYFINLVGFVKEEYRVKTVYPPAGLIFNAFNLCPFSNVKVVLIGQDPYHGRDRRMVCVFRYAKALNFRLALLIFLKRLNLTLESAIHNPATLSVGQNRACCFLMQHLRF